MIRSSNSDLGNESMAMQHFSELQSVLPMFGNSEDLSKTPQDSSVGFRLSDTLPPHDVERPSPLSISSLITPFGDDSMGQSSGITPGHHNSVGQIANTNISGGLLESQSSGTLISSQVRSMENGEETTATSLSENMDQPPADFQGRTPTVAFSLAPTNPLMAPQETTGHMSPGIDSNLMKAFAYNRALPSFSDSPQDLKWVNRFDLDGVQNSIRNVMDFANGPSESTDILESWMISKQADYFGETDVEKYYDHFLDVDLTKYAGSPLSDQRLKPIREVSSKASASPSERSDTRASAFARTSISWRSPSEDGASKDLKSFGDPELTHLSTLTDKVDKQSRKFKRFQILPKTRDAIMLTLSETHHAQFWRDSANVHLPSSEELTLILISYFDHFHTRYHILHLPSFDQNECSTGLLLSILSAGAFFSGLENEALNKIGRYFYEIGRRQLILAFESDNTNIGQLQLQQANLIIFITGSWSGIDRNVEMSQTFTSTIATIIRRRDLFKSCSYMTLQEIMEDPSTTTTEAKWRKWIIGESKKLLVYVMFYWGSQFSILLNFPFYINFSELELPLPHMESLWRSTSPEEWLRLVQLIKSQSPQQYLHHMSFQLLIGSIFSSKEYLQPSLSPKFFSDIIIGNLIATVGHFISEHKDRIAFTSNMPRFSDLKKKRHTLSLDATFHLSYLANRKAEIENMLDSLEIFVSSQDKESQITYKVEIEYSYITLYSSIKDCLKLAGVDGEFESRQAIPRLLQWFKKDESRMAIWHCAQVLELALSLTENKSGMYTAKALIFITNKISLTLFALHDIPF